MPKNKESTKSATLRLLSGKEKCRGEFEVSSSLIEGASLEMA